LVRGLAKSSAKQLYAEQFTINDAAAKTSTLGQPAMPAKKSPNGVLSPRLLQWHWIDGGVAYCLDSASNKSLSPTIPGGIVCASRTDDRDEQLLSTNHSIRFGQYHCRCVGQKRAQHL
jgi:hypothetical protein